MRAAIMGTIKRVFNLLYSRDNAISEQEISYIVYLRMQ